MYTIWTRLRGGRRLLVAAMAVTGALALAVPGFAAHPEASLPGSNFELDIDANLKVDDPVPSIDWASVSDSRQPDLATGRNDDSYAGGTKEDDACPGTTTGSIPNNKSDLLTFGAYVSDPPGLDPGYLHVFWSRVNEPSGTTLMDFELNQSSTDCGNGVNPVRTEGDLLIEYRIEQGGATAAIKVREWTGTAWGEAVDLTGTQAAGTINNSAIPAADSDGLITTGSISPRTFGEASLDLDFIFDEGTCESFGSAFLKSRASDSFTSQLKDFIEPTPVDIQNCGAVEITKTDDVGTALAGAEFTLYEDDGDAVFEPTTDDPVATDQDGNPLVCTTAADGTCSIQSVVFDTYWIDETVVPAGHDKAAGLPQKVTVDSSTTVELTFANPRQRGSIVVEKEDEAGNPLAGAQFALDADGDPATTDDQTPIPSQGVRAPASASTTCCSATSSSSRPASRTATPRRTRSRSSRSSRPARAPGG